MIQTTLRMFFTDILKVMVKRCNEFYERFKPEVVYVFFSAGKDSTAALLAVSRSRLADRALIVYNEIVGNTHRLNVEQAYNIVKRLFGDIPVAVVEKRSEVRAAVDRLKSNLPAMLHIKATNRHGEDFWRSIERWGIPVIRGSGHRWCYAEFKEHWWEELPPTGIYRYVVVGVKATDSHWRMKRWKNTGGVRIFTWGRGLRDVALAPTYDLTTDEVWQVLRQHGLEELLKTYKLCEDSLNCMFCPLRGKEKMEKIIGVLETDILKMMLDTLRRVNRAKPNTVTNTVTELIEAELRRRGVM